MYVDDSTAFSLSCASRKPGPALIASEGASDTARLPINTVHTSIMYWDFTHKSFLYPDSPRTVTDIGHGRQWHSDIHWLLTLLSSPLMAVMSWIQLFYPAKSPQQLPKEACISQPGRWSELWGQA
jgi:hypothetical protein